MSALVLKLIAVVTMLIDHTAASCFYPWGIGSIRLDFPQGWSLYLLGRAVGRIAFPIYCFLITEGVHYTRDWKKYGFRLGLLALVSEIPFDFGLHGMEFFSRGQERGLQAVLQTMNRTADWKHQNVFFTLFLGMLAVQFLKSSGMRLYRLRKENEDLFEGKSGSCLAVFLGLLRYLLWAGLTFVLGYLAKYKLHTDYGMGGVVMISVMGLIWEPWEKWFWMIPRWFIRVVFCGLGLWACCRILDSSLEYYGMLALIPIGLYSGKKGYSNKPLQYGFYFFYPVHLTVLGVLAGL